MRAAVPKHDKVFFLVLLAPSTLVLAFYVLLCKLFTEYSAPVLERFGLSFVLGDVWNPGLKVYEILPALAGTLVTSALAASVALPVSVLATVFLNEYCPKGLARVVSSFVTVMGGMPSIVYGLWGATVLPDLLSEYVMKPLHRYLGFLPPFSCSPVSGWTILTAGALLTIMIVPYMFALINEAYAHIPLKYREALLAIGARPYLIAKEFTRMVWPAIIGALLLGLGRAAGETIAVSLVVGNVNTVPYCLFLPGQTISSLIANNFPEASSYPLMINALYAAGAVLLLVGMVLNVVGLAFMSKWRRVVGS